MTASWRIVFFATGVVGLLWTIWWLRTYEPAARHQQLSAAEREQIAEVLAGRPRRANRLRHGRSLLTYPQCGASSSRSS